MTDRPSSASLATLRWMSAFAPTSMPRVGSSRMISSGPWRGTAPAAPSAGCLPRGRPGRGDAGQRAAHREPSCSSHHLIPVPACAAGAATASRLDAEHHVLGDRELADDALGAAVLRRERDVVADGVPRGRSTRRRAVDLDGAGVRAIARRRAPDELRAARSRAGPRSRPPRRRRPRGRRPRARRVDRRLARRTGRGRAVDRRRRAVRRVGGEVVELSADHLGHELFARQVADEVLADDRCHCAAQ